MSAIMSNSITHSQEASLNALFDEEVLLGHPAIRGMDDVRSYAEIVYFWEPVTFVPKVVDIQPVYNPSKICRDAANRKFNNYFHYGQNRRPSNNYRSGLTIIKNLTPRPINPWTHYEKLVFGLTKRWSEQPQKFLEKFFNIVCFFNPRTYARKHSGEPITKRFMFMCAIRKVWQNIKPIAKKHKPPLHRGRYLAPGELERLPCQNFGSLEISEQILKARGVWSDARIKSLPFGLRLKNPNKINCNYNFINSDEFLELEYQENKNFFKNILIYKNFKKQKSIYYSNYLKLKNLMFERKSQINLNFNLKKKFFKPYSKFYTNPKVFVSTSDSQYINWCKQKYVNLVLLNKPNTNYEMDTAHSEGVAAVQCKKSGNVIFMDETAASTAKPQKRLSTRMKSVAHADPPFAMKHAVGRELVLETFEWSDNSAGTLLKVMTFPAIIQKALSNSPNSIPFKMSTFMNSDIEINIRVNSNKFQVGMLQCSWLYDPDADENIQYRKNIYTLSQTNHCLINAGGSNVGSIYIPFISTFTSLPTVKNMHNNQCLNLGKLFIYVLNRLNCPDTIAKTCSVTVSVKIINPEFYGQKPIDVGTFVYPEMEIVGEVLAVKAAEKLLTTVNGDNRDNPPYQGPSTKMVPMSNQSFCLGDQVVEPINCLRLDARGQHLPQVNGLDEMSIKHVVSVYGLVQTIQWQASQATGTIIKTWDASPVLLTGEYSGFKIKSDDFYCIPPVAVISSMFAYWSGELKFRFDFVASQFHTGRVMVVYVPYITSPITFEQAKSYPYEVWDLREHQQFIFNVPYISNYPCYKRRIGYTSTVDVYIPPGKLYMFVLNKLVPMDNVSNQIDINVYMAGGDTFEVQIPAQPSIATCFYATDDVPSKLVKAVDGSYPWYFGNDSIFVDDKSVEHAILRYSSFWNDISFFYNLQSWKYYKMTDLSAKANENVSVVFEQGTYFIKNLFYVPIQLDDGSGLTHMAACASLLQAQNYWRKGPQGAGRQEILTIADLTSSPDCIGNPVFDEFDVPQSDEFVVVNHEMEERQVGNNLEQETTDCRVYGFDDTLGHGIFGEKFTSLKTLCRRYQPYGVATPTSTPAYGDVLFSFPAIPHGLDLYLANKKLLPIMKKVREGIIPLVLSGYRFFSGGLRFNMVCGVKQKNVWIQHRPDYEGQATISYPSKDKTIESLINSGYAMYLQSTAVNNVINFEVPYYKNRPMIYLQKPAASHSPLEGALHLGQIYVGAEGGTSTEAFSCGILYSLADDAHAHVFQGFPPMLFLDTIQNAKTYAARRRVNYEMPLLTHSVELPKEATEALSNVSNLINTLDDKFAGLHDVMGNIKSNMKSVLMNLVGDIGHVMINPNYKTMIWSIITLLLKFGMIQNCDITKIIQPLKNIVSVIIPDDSQPNISTEPTYLGDVGVMNYARNNIDDLIPPVHHEAPMDTCHAEFILPYVIKFITAIVCCVSSILSMKTPPEGSTGLFSTIANLTHRIAICSRDLKSLGEFFSGLIEACFNILQYIGLYNRPTKIFEHILATELPLINDWFTEAKYLCDVTREEHVFARDGALADRLEECYAMGVTISNHFISFYDSSTEEKKRLLGPQFTIFKDAFAEVSSKRNDMLSRGYSSISRREPFCIYLSGPPGCGKSQMAQSLIPKLLQDQGIRYVGEPIYTLMCGADYWNGCKHQPCVLIDDWLSVDSGTLKENDLKAFTTLKSCAILNPPQAALPDKQMRYAPEMVVVLSNKSFPEPIGVDHTMIWRRRDVLVECRMIKALSTFSNMTDAKEALFKKINELGLVTRSPCFEHLEFRIAKQPSNPKTRWTHNDMDSWMGYGELMLILNKEFTMQRNWQLTAFSERRALYESSLINERDNFTPSLKDKREEFQRACKFLSTYIAKESVKNVNIFKLAAEYSKRGFIPPEDRDKIILASRDSQLDQMKTQKIPPLGQKDFVRFECPDFECKENSCPTKTIDIIPSIEMVLKDEKLKSSICTDSNVLTPFCFMMSNLCSFAMVTKNAEKQLCTNLSSLQLLKITSKSDPPKTIKYHMGKIPLSAITAIQMTILKNVANQQSVLTNTKIEIDDKARRFKFSFTYQENNYSITSTYDEVYKVHGDNTKDPGSIEKIPVAKDSKDMEHAKTNKLTIKTFEYYDITFEALYVNCGKLVGQCNHRPCYILFGYGDAFDKKFPGFYCKCKYFNPTYIYDIKEKVFIKNNDKIDLSSCLDPLCFQKTDNWPSRVSAWKKSNPALVKLKQCPEDFQCYTDGIVIFIDGIKKYFKEHFPGTYNFFDNYVSPIFKRIFNVFTALLPYVIGIGAIGALLHFLGYSDVILAKALDLKRSANDFFTWGNKATVAMSNHPRGRPASNLSIGELLEKNKDLKHPDYYKHGYFTAWVEDQKQSIKVNEHNIRAIDDLIEKWADSETGFESTFKILQSEEPQNDLVDSPADPLGETISQIEHELIHSGDNAKPKKLKNKNSSKTVKLRKVGRLESGLFFNEGYINLRDRIKKNTYFMMSPFGDRFRVVFIYHQRILFLKHYYEELKPKFKADGWKMINCVSLKEYEISPDKWNFDFVDDSQIGFTTVLEIPPHRTLIKSFVESEQDHKRGVGQCIIVSPSVGGCEQICVMPTFNPDGLYINPRSEMSGQQLASVYEYNWSAYGNCCSLLLDPKRNPSILGVHVAGNGITGYSECLSKEQFKEWFPKSVEREEDFDDSIVVSDEVDERLKGQFVPIGKIHHELAHNESGESQIKPSKIHGKVFPVTTAIAPLSNHDPRMPLGYSPMFSGVNNMFKPPKIFNNSDILEAENYFNHQLLSKCKPVLSVTRKRDLLEVIDGIPGEKFFEGLVMNTSEGYPFSSFRPKHARNKTWLFQRTGNPIQTIGIDRNLDKMLISEKCKRANLIAINTVFVDCLKDARLPLNKVLVEGKTRIFSISPVQYTIAFKEMFMDFLAAFKTHRMELEHAVGISPDGPQWGNLVRVLNRSFEQYGIHFDETTEGVYLSGDYKNFGPTLSSQIVNSINRLILNWCDFYYKDSNQIDRNIRECLLYERTFSYHLCFNNLYQVVCGAPSGGPDTVELNSMVNKYYIYLAFKNLLNSYNSYCLQNEKLINFQPDMFKNLIHVMTYGDDVIFKVHPKLKTIFNNKTLSAFFLLYNIGYTDATKQDDYKPFNDNLSDITFLKRGFIPHPKWLIEYLAPLDEDVSVKDVCNWIHKSDYNTPDQATYLSIEGCGANAYSLGPEKHSVIRTALNHALIDLGCDKFLRTWDNWDEIHFLPYYLFTRDKS